MWPSGERSHAHERLRSLLRLFRLRNDAYAASGFLLRFLFLWFRSVPADPTGRTLLRSASRGEEATRDAPMTSWTDEDELCLSIAMALSKIKTKPRGAERIPFTGRW